MESFKIERSLLKRLRTVMVAIAVFFLVSFFGIYLSSLDFLRGLSAVNTANSILAMTTQAVDGIDTSLRNLEKISSNIPLADIQYSHRQSQKLLQSLLIDATSMSEGTQDIREPLLVAQESIKAFNQSVQVLFVKVANLPSRTNQAGLQVVKAEILVAQQFAIEAKEGLRKAQIRIKEISDNLFSSIYAKRFRPLLVTTVLTIIFVTFVITFGLSLSRRLTHSLNNLTRATEAVGEGDLNHKALILEPDEIGRLTFAFNQMVSSLRKGRSKLDQVLKRIQDLQNITASFSEALTVRQVSDVTVRQGLKALNAQAGAIALLEEGMDELKITSEIGLDADQIAYWNGFSLHSKLPMAEALRYSRPLFFKNINELHEKYGDKAIGGNFNSAIFIPLDVATSKLGTLGFFFKEPKNFSRKEQEFIVAIGRQCAQALHRSELYDDARDAILARDEFLSIASHELKTPLTPLKLQLQMLARQARKEQVIGSEKLVKIVETSDKQLGRLSRLIEDLLDVSRITTGRLTLNFEEFDLGEMIRDVIFQYGHQLKDALKKVEFQNGSDVRGEFDRVRMEQVLINLLTNAAKYAPGKPIIVRLEKRKGGRARIYVSDQGPGIDRENQDRIFGRFERVRGNDNIGGLGLGLYISRQIIAAHQGDIWVESKNGKGSTFIIEVPLHQSEELASGEVQLH